MLDDLKQIVVVGRILHLLPQKDWQPWLFLHVVHFTEMISVSHMLVVAETNVREREVSIYTKTDHLFVLIWNSSL